MALDYRTTGAVRVRRQRTAHAASRWLAAAVLACACDRDPSEPAPEAEPATIRADASADVEAPGAPEAESGDAPEAAVKNPPGSTRAQPEPDTPEPVLPPPKGFRRALKAMMVYAEPDFSAPFRGKIGRRDRFAIHASVQGDPACKGEGWAQVAVAGYACLEHTESVSTPPRTLPVVPDGMLTPFYWARLKKKTGPDGQRPPAPIWRSLPALRRGDDPVGELEPARDYAFTRRRRGRGGPFLSDDTHRTIRERDVQVHRPSDFGGRDLHTDPVPEGQILGWSVQWPSAGIRDQPRVDVEPDRGIEFHAVFLADPDTEPVQHRGTTFVALADDTGWVDAKDIRRYLPTQPLPGVGEDELWLDVDLEQQILVLWVGTEPRFVTLVSSGNWKNPTPVGIYRITTKQAYGDMRSRPDEEDPYWVESVPWVLYFDGRYALHGTFWHGRFGRRTSHGCINLAPKDAARVFEGVQPELPPGWMIAYEHAEALGTTLRIRKGDEAPPDRRAEVLERTAE